MEEWREAADNVEVSSHGNVRDLTSRNPKNIYHDAFGYPTVTAKIEGKSKAVRVHRLVASAFITNSDNLNEVNHKDGNPKNNHISNLEWCTHQYNMQHTVDTGLRLGVGVNHHWNKLKEHEILEILKLKWVYGLSHRLIASLYGISHQHVSDISKQKKCWKKLQFTYSI